MSIFSVSTQKYSSNNEKTKDIAQNLQRLELTKDTQQSIYSVKFKDKNELAYQSDNAGFMGR